MLDYSQLLKRGLEKVPKKTGSGERFELPQAQTQKDGRKTIIVNFHEIATKLRREPEHFLKFLLKELATKGEFSNERLVVLGNFPTDMINKKIELYVKQFVICPECGRPDTKLSKEDRIAVMRCEACGARHTIASV